MEGATKKGAGGMKEGREKEGGDEISQCYPPVPRRKDCLVLEEGPICPENWDWCSDLFGRCSRVPCW